MIFRQLFDRETCTYTYLIADEETREAVLIDTVAELTDRDKQFIDELDLKLKYLLETHIHADHITGIANLKQHFPEAQSVVSKYGGTDVPDILVDEGDILKLGQIEIKVLRTQGHTDSCLTYHVNDRVFTGDALFVRGCGRTDFQQGDAGQLYDNIHQKIFSLPDETLIFPGHDYKGRTVSTVREEKQHNPRLGQQKTRAEFIDIMNHLNLSPPKKLDVAVPANLKCGAI